MKVKGKKPSFSDFIPVGQAVATHTKKKKKEIANGKSVILNVIILKLSPTDTTVHAKFYLNLSSSYAQMEEIDGQVKYYVRITASSSYAQIKKIDREID